jgi:hypothetical protein
MDVKQVKHQSHARLTPAARTTMIIWSVSMHISSVLAYENSLSRLIACLSKLTPLPLTANLADDTP